MDVHVKHSSAGVSDVSMSSKKKTTTATATTDQMLSVHESWATICAYV
jgi:hypothetical protein